MNRRALRHEDAGRGAEAVITLPAAAGEAP
jgi:hypothetical protein